MHKKELRKVENLYHKRNRTVQKHKTSCVQIDAQVRLLDMLCRY